MGDERCDGDVQGRLLKPFRLLSSVSSAHIYKGESSMNIAKVRDRSKLDVTARSKVERTFEFPELLPFDRVKRDFSSVIFDFDGTLADSMWVWEQIDDRFCEKYELELPPGYYEMITTLTFEGTARYFHDVFGLPMSTEEIAQEFNALAYDSYAHDVLCKTGVIRYLEMLRERGVSLAIATSLPWSLLEVALDHNQIAGCFDDIAFCDESADKKNPDVYLLAAQRIGARPEDCLVFEDLATGIRSARGVGMTTCAVISGYRHQDEEELMEAADFHIRSYEELLLQ